MRSAVRRARIRRVGVRVVAGEVGSGPASNARHRWTTRRGILVQLTDDEGRVGQGEASPLPGYSPDRFEDVLDALADWAIGPLDTPLDPGLPSARFAVETAFADLRAQGEQLSLPTLLARPREPAAALPVAVLLPGLDDPDPDVALRDVLDAARRAVEVGVRTLKLKIGRQGAFARELEAVATLRRELGSEFRLRLDANGGFAPDEAARRLEALAPHRLEMVEEPVAGRAALRELAATGPAVALGLDESLQGGDAWDELEPIVRPGVCRALVLKPAVLGLVRSLELADRAAERNVATVVTHAFDGPVGLAAAAAVALAVSGERLDAGLARHAGLEAWPAVELPFLGPRGIVLWSDPGLGLAPLEVGLRGADR